MSIEYPYHPIRETPLASDDEVKYMLKRLHLKWGDKVKAGIMLGAGGSDVSAAKIQTASAGGGELQPGLIPALPHSARSAPTNAGVVQSVGDTQASPSAEADRTVPAGIRAGSSPASSALIWHSPTRNSDGSRHLKDATGAYTVLAERRSGGEGWQYLAFHGSAVLAPSCATAECAKAHCIAHHEREPPCP